MINSASSQGVAGASRKAVFDSFRTFQQVPKNVTALAADDAHRLQILNCSENFREQLRTLSADIGIIAERYGEFETTLDADYDTVYTIEKSWQICEIFSLNPTKLLSIELMKWLKELCYEQPLEVFLAQIQDSDEPESMNLRDIGSGSNGDFGYWDLVYRFVLQGDMQSALTALRVHSEISEALSQLDNHRGNRNTVVVSGNAITSAQCESFFDLLATHPFAGMVKQPTSCSSSNNDFTAAGLLSREAVLASTTHTIGVEFSAWQNRVRKLRQSNMTLLARIPELDTILRILSGDISTLEHLCGIGSESEEENWSWGKLAIALLLFVYPPPLNKSDLCRVVEECMQKGSAGYGSSSLGKGYITTLREVMTGNVAPTLRSFYQLSVSTNAAHSAHARALSLVPLLCTAHLSLLLVSGAGKEDLLIPLDHSANEASFFEEIFLEAASRLHNLGFPVEVILSYLSVCPMRGKEYARVLLPLVRITSDKVALAVSQVLRDSLGLYSEAASLLVARGNWWLRSNPSPPLRSSASERSARDRQLRSSTLAKAAYFYQEAGDAARLQVVLESSLSRCMWAVVSNPQAFPGLHLLPSSCSLYGKALRAPRLPRAGDASVPEESSLLELEAALVEAEELLQAVDPSYFDQALGANLVGLCCQGLRSYSTAVQGRFAAPNAGTLKRSAQELASLVVDPVRGPCVPIRYWLHTLELVGWFANSASGLEGDSSVGDVGAGDYGMESDEGRPSGAVFTKAQAYALLSALQEVCTSHGADILLNDAAVLADAGTNTTIAQMDKLQVLRLSLLGLLASSTVHENAERRSNRAQDDSYVGRSGFVGRSTFGRTVTLNSRGFSKLASATGRFQTQDNDSFKKALAFEMLSGSSVGFI